MKKKKCPWHNKCRNGGDGCVHHDPERCVRFLPLEGTNLTKVDLIIETPPRIDSAAFSEMLWSWIDCMGWSGAGATSPYTIDDDISDDQIHNREYADDGYTFEVGM